MKSNAAFNISLHISVRELVLSFVEDFRQIHLMIKKHKNVCLWLDELEILCTEQDNGEPLIGTGQRFFIEGNKFSRKLNLVKVQSSMTGVK